MPKAPARATIAAKKKSDLGHERGAMLVPQRRYSPAARSGLRSSGSASSISLVKMRSERL